MKDVGILHGGFANLHLQIRDWSSEPHLKRGAGLLPSFLTSSLHFPPTSHHPSSALMLGHKMVVSVDRRVPAVRRVDVVLLRPPHRLHDPLYLPSALHNRL